MMNGNNRNFFGKRPNIQFKRRGGNNNYKKGRWNDSSRKQPSEDYQLLNTVYLILCPSKSSVVLLGSSPTKNSSKQNNHENLAEGNEMEPHCAAQDALLKVHDRIVEEDRFGGVTFDDDNENTVVTSRLLVPNNMNPRKDKPPSGFPMPFLSPRNLMLSNRAPSHTMLPMPWTGGYENRSGFAQSWEIWWVIGKGSFNVKQLQLETGASIHAQDASKDSEESVIHVSAFENRTSEFSDKGIITTRLLVIGCLLGQRGHESNANDIHATFVKYVKSNDWDKAIQFLRDHPQVGSERISSGGTALRYAVRPLNNCSVRNIEQLVELMAKEDLEIQDTIGSTDLYLLITFRQNRVEVVAKRMVEKNDKLLSILPAGTTPLVVFAPSLSIGERMARYLYSVTPRKTLHVTDASQFISLGFRYKRFGKRGNPLSFKHDQLLMSTP
ncbi:hypothetical protein C1H46_021289 [Malus baccata]|uniref:Uncharacterized protein n=1 Tax=Malus baccata TaxID=106549 RepID=A0A540M3K9_MALBA|nr:hypothetical protein C1H46_021289 [Malus baccata]